MLSPRGGRRSSRSCSGGRACRVVALPRRLVGRTTINLCERCGRDLSVRLSAAHSLSSVKERGSHRALRSQPTTPLLASPGPVFRCLVVLLSCVGSAKMSFPRRCPFTTIPAVRYARNKRQIDHGRQPALLFFNLLPHRGSKLAAGPIPVVLTRSTHLLSRDR